MPTISAMLPSDDALYKFIVIYLFTYLLAQ